MRPQTSGSRGARSARRRRARGPDRSRVRRGRRHPPGEDWVRGRARPERWSRRACLREMHVESNHRPPWRGPSSVRARSRERAHRHRGGAPSSASRPRVHGKRSSGAQSGFSEESVHRSNREDDERAGRPVPRAAVRKKRTSSPSSAAFTSKARTAGTGPRVERASVATDRETPIQRARAGPNHASQARHCPAFGILHGELDGEPLKLAAAMPEARHTAGYVERKANARHAEDELRHPQRTDRRRRTELEPETIPQSTDGARPSPDPATLFRGRTGKLGRFLGERWYARPLDRSKGAGRNAKFGAERFPAYRNARARPRRHHRTLNQAGPPVRGPRRLRGSARPARDGRRRGARAGGRTAISSSRPARARARRSRTSSPPS